MRVLLVARLSRMHRDGREGMGLETQDQGMTAWATREEHTIVDTVADTKRGTVAPWDRKNLRPWVTDPVKMSEYDAILAFAMDRLTRGEWKDEARIRQWAEENGKTLIIADGPQWPPRHDGDFWSWTSAAKAARQEWEAIQERNKRSQAALLAKGKLVGRAPWGYEVAGEEYDKRLVPAGAGRTYIPEVFRRCLAGDSAGTIAAWLTAEGVRPSKGTVWSPVTVTTMLRCSTYAGLRRDSSGKIVHQCEPVITQETFDAAGQAITARDRRRRGGRTPARPSALLTGLLTCSSCQGPLYRAAGRGRETYRCSASPAFGSARQSACHFSIPLEAADMVARSILSASTAPVMVSVWEAGDDTAVRLAQVAAAIAEASRAYGAGELALPAYMTTLGPLDAEKRELEKAEPAPGRYVSRPTGRTFGDLAREAADDGALRDLVKAGGGRFIAVRPGDASVTIPAGDAFPVMTAGGGDLPRLVFGDAGVLFPDA